MLNYETRAQGIKFRQEQNEAVAGYFSNIGEQYLVYHFWGTLHYIYINCGVDHTLALTGFVVRKIGNMHIYLQRMKACRLARRSETMLGDDRAGMM